MNSHNDEAIQDIVQPTELGESLRELNDDGLEPNSRMSRIDMRTRLHPFEINSILAMDTLVSLGVLPTACLSYTRQKKRLNVSLGGEGRREMVNVVAGKREQEQGPANKFREFFGMGGGPQQ